jgi:hypothetical protein
MERADGEAAGDDGFIPAKGSKLATCNNWDGSGKPVNGYSQVKGSYSPIRVRWVIHCNGILTSRFTICPMKS